MEKDILLVSDGNTSYPMCAQALGVGHEVLNLSQGKRTRGVQTVNNRHSRLKNFLARYKGIATKYLDNYLRWFHLVVLEKNSSSGLIATPSFVETSVTNLIEMKM